jgi:hypothetical protein
MNHTFDITKFLDDFHADHDVTAYLPQLTQAKRSASELMRQSSGDERLLAAKCRDFYRMLQRLIEVRNQPARVRVILADALELNAQIAELGKRIESGGGANGV